MAFISVEENSLKRYFALGEIFIYNHFHLWLKEINFQLFEENCFSIFFLKYFHQVQVILYLSCVMRERKEFGHIQQCFSDTRVSEHLEPKRAYGAQKGSLCLICFIAKWSLMKFLGLTGPLKMSCTL